MSFLSKWRKEPSSTPRGLIALVLAGLGLVASVGGSIVSIFYPEALKSSDTLVLDAVYNNYTLTIGYIAGGIFYAILIYRYLQRKAETDKRDTIDVTISGTKRSFKINVENPRSVQATLRDIEKELDRGKK